MALTGWGARLPLSGLNASACLGCVDADVSGSTTCTQHNYFATSAVLCLRPNCLLLADPCCVMASLALQDLNAQRRQADAHTHLRFGAPLVSSIVGGRRAAQEALERRQR